MDVDVVAGTEGGGGDDVIADMRDEGMIAGLGGRAGGMSASSE